MSSSSRVYTPVVAAAAVGTLYFAAANGVVTAVAVATGAPLWTSRTVDDDDDGRDSVTSPWLSLSINGTVLLSAYDESLRAVDAASGATVWTTELGCMCQPAVGSVDVVYVGNDDNTVNALDASNGFVRWTFVPGAAVYAVVVVDEDSAVSVSWDGVGATAAVDMLTS